MRRLPGLLAVLLLAGCGTSAGAGSVPAPSGSGGPDAAPEVVTLGDSVPAGTACDCAPFPALYAERIGAGSDDLAVPGATSEDLRDQIGEPATKAALRAADVVLVMTGANDLAVAFDAGDSAYPGPAAGVERNVEAIVGAVHALSPAASVVVLGYWNVVEDGAVGREDYDDDGVAEAASATTYCNDALRRAAGATGATYLDTTAALKGGSGERDPTALLAADGDHPDAAGHRAIAALLDAALPTG